MSGVAEQFGQAAVKPLRYDSATIALHWITAALVVLCWLSIQISDVFGHGAFEQAVVSSHVSMGVALTVVIAARLIWRLTSGRSLPGADSGLMELAARATHYALYLLVGAILVLGFATLWARGADIWGLISITGADPTHTGLARTTRGLHGLAANAILVLAGLHAAAALFHHYVLRDGVLRRMLPRS